MTILPWWWSRPGEGTAARGSDMAKKLIFIGCLLIVAGLLWPILEKLNLGRLPGDILIDRDDFRFYFPITTCLVVSIVLTILIWLFKKWW